MSVLKIPTAEVFTPLLAPARYKGAHGGRGSAKSHFFAGLAIEDAVRFPGDCGEGLRILCFRETQMSLQHSSKALIEYKLAQHRLGEADGFKVFKDVIQFPKDGLAIFKGMQDQTSESVKSFENMHRAWGEEAQRIKVHSLDILRPTIRWENKRLGMTSEMWFSWNPDSADDPVDALLRGENPPPDSIVVESNYTDNPWFPAILKQELEYDRTRDPEKYRHVWLGEYVSQSNARVFHNWTVEEFDAPDGTVFRFGADWGFAIDPSVLIRCYINGNKLYVDYEAYMVGCEINQLPDLFDRIPDSRRWFITADSARPETISYMQKHGYPKINAAIKGPKSIEDGIEWLKSYDIVVHPRCVHVIDELKLYSYKIDPMTEDVLPILADKHNHTIDALRYACEGARKARKPAQPEHYETTLHWMG